DGGIGAPALDAPVVAELRERHGNPARVLRGLSVDAEMKLGQRRAFFGRVRQSVVYVQHGSADHAIIRARSIASEILMMSEQGSASSAPRVAPHPLLKSYYADEPARKRRVNEMFDS